MTLWRLFKGGCWGGIAWGVLALLCSGQARGADVAGPVDVIVHNQDAKGVEVIGDWELRGPDEAAYRGKWLDDKNGQKDKSVVFTPELPEDGTYLVFGRWLEGKQQASNARYIIKHAAGESVVMVDQKSNGGTWYELGSFSFKAGTSGSVTLSDTGADGFVSADAVRFVKDRVVVDCSSTIGPVTHRAGGALSSFSLTKPEASLFDPLHLHMFRTSTSTDWGVGVGAFDSYRRMRESTTLIQVVLSDAWGYPNREHGWPGKDGDFGPWNKLVATTVQKAHDDGCVFQWDIWNEPDWKSFWPQGGPEDRQRYYLTWMSAYKTIRAIDPKAEIVGPSIGWREKWLQDFLLWAKEHECVPTVISWHQFGKWGEDSARVTANVAKIKAWMAQNGMEVNRFSINEYIGREAQTNPGVAVWAMDDLERAKVESAAHSCWNDPDGAAQFHNYSLDGLLTNGGLQPRSSWWVYKYYGDLSGHLVQVSAAAGSARGVASFDESKKELRMIFGRALGPAPAGATIDVPVTVTNVAAPGFFVEGQTVSVQARRIANSDYAPVPAEPALTVNGTAVIEHGQIVVTLPNFGSSDAYAVTIQKLLPVK